MNFLSHFYFDRFSTSNLEILGTVLPDLIRNSAPNANVFPNKFVGVFDGDEFAILGGWNKHLLVDKLFHSSSFFNEQTSILKPLIKPIVIGTQIRPSFLAHISLELVLDHLLLENKTVDVGQFYSALANIDFAVLKSFLRKSKLSETDQFFNFYNKFLEHSYLTSYSKLESVAYALNQICLRLWPICLNDRQQEELTQMLSLYKSQIKDSYKSIFDEITIEIDNKNGQ